MDEKVDIQGKRFGRLQVVGEAGRGANRGRLKQAFDQQGGRCGICAGPCSRGRLCGNCNNGLGHFRDDPKRLRDAAAYIAGAHSAV